VGLRAEVGTGDIRGAVVCACEHSTSRCRSSPCAAYNTHHWHHWTVPHNWLQIIWTAARAR